MRIPIRRNNGVQRHAPPPREPRRRGPYRHSIRYPHLNGTDRSWHC
jgi:hypothetical protein